MLRLAAYELLRSHETLPLRNLERIAERYELDARDRAFLRRLVSTVQRRLGTLRAITVYLSRNRPKPDLGSFVHLGLAQLLFMDRVPDHAAVSETVLAVNEVLGLSKGRYVNGVLRNAIRLRREGHSGDPRRDLPGIELHLETPVFRDPDEHPLLWGEDALSMPAPLLKAWTKEFGRERAEALSLQALGEPPLSVRVVSTELENVLAELKALSLEPLRTDGAMLLFAGSATVDVLGSDAFREGRITIQGGAAHKAATFVEARSSEDILDLCAAPGGKTAVLAASGARVTACDTDAGKLDRLRSTLERLGVAGQVECLESDGTSALAERTFDAALVDAPCSNTGVLGQRPEARWRFGPGSSASLQELQARLFREAADRVRPGGRLVWSTCSLEPGENRAQVRAFLKERPEWTLQLDELTLPDFVQGPIDGGFVARLVRSS